MTIIAKHRCLALSEVVNNPHHRIFCQRVHLMRLNVGHTIVDEKRQMYCQSGGKAGADERRGNGNTALLMQRWRCAYHRFSHFRESEFFHDHH